MNETGIRRILPDQSTGSLHTSGTPRHPNITNPIISKRVCFYKSGDPQFSGLRMVINNRTFKTFDGLLDSLSKKVPLPFGVRNITTPRGVHAVYTLEDLEDGKSYICSDSRKVKPINLAVARKRPPPWYHARPVSSRRRTVQQARVFPGWRNRMQEPVVVRTPKKLLVFRNGDPSVRHNVVLEKRSTATFEVILEYISELMQFRVVKLHTSDGRRVDGLPGLILSSGTVVAAGREPFRPANYNAQKSPAQTRQPTNRMGVRRLKAFNRKKRSLSQSRHFSPSSERYIVNRIHNSIGESSCDLPSNLTNSSELESGHMLESVAEMDDDACLGNGAEGQDCMVPTEDDIEKSFRVNQDGSMTVEMRVRLTIKEEETLHWTTTLSRSSVASQLNMASLTDRDLGQQICPPESNSLDLQDSAASTDSINKDRTSDDNDEDPPALSNGAPGESSTDEDNSKMQMDVVSPRRAPTPGHRQIRKKQASMESIKSVTADGIQEVGAYSYREQSENGAMAQQYCMVKQSSTRPVPKPRRFGSVDTYNANDRSSSSFKSAGMTEILQMESSGEEVAETVLHIYEQQTCRDNFHANICGQGTSLSGIPFYRPATPETGRHSCGNELESENWRPSTASESISIWRAENVSVTSDFMSPSLRAGVIQATERRHPFPKATLKGKEKPQEREVNKDKRIPTKPGVVDKRFSGLMSPGKSQSANSGTATKKKRKVKTFSSAGFIKRIYGNKSKSGKSMMKLKKRATQYGKQGVTTKSSQSSDDTTRHAVKDANIPSSLKVNVSETVSLETSSLEVSPSEGRQPRGILTRQTSMHQEKKKENESCDVSESMSLPAFNSSSSFANKYVQNWLEKAHINPAALAESTDLEARVPVTPGNGESEYNHPLLAAAEDVRCLEENLESQTRQACKSDPQADNELGNSVKRRITSFENKSGSSQEASTVTQQAVQSHTPTPHTGSSSQVENKSRPIKISIQKATISESLSMELLLPPPPPPAAESPVESPVQSYADYHMMDVPSGASSPLYRDSSVSSHMSQNYPSSVSSTSDKAVSSTDPKRETTTSAQTGIPLNPGGAQLPRSHSIKRAQLVSNVSFERKMSLRKACLDNYALCSDAPSETSASPAPITTASDVPPNSTSLTVIQRPSNSQAEGKQQSTSHVRNSPSICTDASPASLTSEERASPDSVSSSEAPTPPVDLPLKETNVPETPPSAQKDAASPKTLVKKARPISSPFSERKPQTKKSSSELPNKSPQLSSLHRPLDKITSPGTGKRGTPNASPSLEGKQIPYKSKLQRRPSPYSQSLDMASPPATHRSNRKLLSRNLSSDSAPEPSNKTPRTTPPLGKLSQTQQSIKSAAELGQPQTYNVLTPPDANQTDDIKETDDSRGADQEEAMTDAQALPLNIENQPNMKPVLEKICYSIKSIRQITQNKRPSCLEKSNSLPDFSSHVASTFGSSSKALLAFLSVMTLKEGMTNLNMDELNANNVSCAEALKMIDCLREIASIEDSHRLKNSLSDLQKSASKQLLESWKGFQELSHKCKSRSSTPNYSEEDLIFATSVEEDCGIEEKVIDQIMDGLDIPETLKEELSSFTTIIGNESDGGEKLEFNDNTNADVTPLFTNDADKVKSIPRDDKANVDVGSMIKKFTDITQPTQSNLGSMTEIPRQKTKPPSYKATKGEEDQYGQNSEATCPLTEVKQLSEERHTSSEITQSCRDAMNEENQEETEEHDLESRQLQMQTTLENELPLGNEPGSGDAWQKVSEQRTSCEEAASSSGASEQQTSEEEPEVECEEIRQESKGGDVSSPESILEEEDDSPGTNYHAELTASRKQSISSPDNDHQSSSDEEQLEIECQELCQQTSANMSSSERRQEESQAGTCDSDPDVESPSEEEQPRAKCTKLKVITEESLSEEQESMEDEEQLDAQRSRAEQVQRWKLNSWKEETEEESEDEDFHADRTRIDEKTTQQKKDQSNLIENQDSYIIKDSVSLDVDEDSGNDHGSCEEHVDVEEDSGNSHGSCEEHVDVDQSEFDHEQIHSSFEEELSYYEKESSSEEELANMSRNIEDSCEDHQAVPAKPSEGTKCEKKEHQSEDIILQSVAERIILLEKQVADAQTAKTKTSFSQRNAQLQAEVEESEIPTSQPAACTRLVPQSSLSFSYDSSGTIATEPEGNRVRSIREMFLAKVSTDVQHGQRRQPSPKATETSELKAETSASGGYQSQTSGEVSSGEDDSSRKSITKGFVRRTIERLYGKTDADPGEEASERLPSAPKPKKREHSSIFSPFHIARSKAMSELSYFNSTNALDTLSEATRCIAFNAQVGPGDSVPIDTGRWLLRENTLIRKSVSDPVGINKNLSDSPKGEGTREDTKEDTPYSLFSANSVAEDEKKPLSRKCTYFSLPHTNDSEVCQDEPSTASRIGISGDSVIETEDGSDSGRACAERSDTLPSVASFSMKDNKVHPMIKGPADGEVVVAQPGKGQGAVNRFQEPDMLDLVYNFCGQHCPIL